eukprot:6127842-Prymnesium_polylepis.1
MADRTSQAQRTQALSQSGHTPQPRAPSTPARPVSECVCVESSRVIQSRVSRRTDGDAELNLIRSRPAHRTPTCSRATRPAQRHPCSYKASSVVFRRSPNLKRSDCFAQGAGGRAGAAQWPH